MPESYSLEDLGYVFNPLGESAQDATRRIDGLEQSVSNLSRSMRSMSQQNTQLMQMLTQSMSSMSDQVSALVASLQNLNSTTSRNRQTIQETSMNMDSMFEVYRKMGVEVNSLNLDLKTLTFTESEYNKVMKIGNEYNTQRDTAYAQLSRKYTAIKVLLNNMTEAEKQNTQEGRNLVALSRQIYEQMNMFQQQTGKFQLQVGNYSKAMTGLNIATQQVVRELPVLAQSAQMFVMAISNNVPILVDNIKAVKASSEAAQKLKDDLEEVALAAAAGGDSVTYMAKKAEAEAIKIETVGQGLKKSILSWQTLLVVVLSVLPRVIKAIQDKRKAMEEAAKAGKNLANALKIVAEGTASVNAEAEKSVNTIESMTYIMNDSNRSMDDRIAAVKVLREETGDLLDVYSDQEVIEGRATEAINNHTEALIKQANAQGYLNKIAELADKRADVEYRRIELEFKIADQEEELAKLREKERIKDEENNRYYEEMGARSGAGFVPLANDYTQARIAMQNALDATKKELSELDYNKQMSEFERAQKMFLDLLDPQWLSQAIQTGGSKGVKDALNKMVDYYFDYNESVARLNEDANQKEIMLLDLKYDKQVESLEKTREQLREEGNLTEEQEKYINGIIINLREEQGREINALIEKQMDEERQIKLDKEIETLKLQLDTEDNMAIERYNNDLLQKRALIKNEIAYWNEYMLILARYGVLSAAEIKNIQANIARLEEQFNDAIPQSILGWLGLISDTKFTKRQEANLKKMYSNATKFMNEWMDARIEMAKIAVEAAEKETEATKKMLDYEMEARANGYAYNITLARKEYEEKLKLEREAIAEQERLQKIQEQIDTATQASSLVTATAELWASMGKAGTLAVVLASAATAAMWASFIGAKYQAAQLTRKKMFGEGGMEYLDYGGSHASGHDIDFGHTKDGTQRTVERGEIIGVINKRNVSKYGVHTIKGVIDSLNNGTFEDKYGLKYAMLGGSRTDLSRLEKGVDSLVSQGEKRTYVSGGKTIEVYKHSKRVILN